MRVTHIESDGAGGWLVEWEGTRNNGRPLAGYVHVTDQWLRDFHQHQLAPNRRPEVKFNRLVYAVRNGTAEQVADTFADMYADAVGARRTRSALGMKAVSSHGDADVEAVLSGEPVRPHNAANPAVVSAATVRDFARRRRDNRKK